MTFEHALCVKVPKHVAQWTTDDMSSDVAVNASIICGYCDHQQACRTLAETTRGWGIHGGVNYQDGAIRITVQPTRPTAVAVTPKPRAKRGGRPRGIYSAEHGTRAGYQRHRSERTTPCPECQEANRNYQTELRARKRGAA